MAHFNLGQRHTPRSQNQLFKSRNREIDHVEVRHKRNLRVVGRVNQFTHFRLRQDVDEKCVCLGISIEMVQHCRSTASTNINHIAHSQDRQVLGNTTSLSKLPHIK